MGAACPGLKAVVRGEGQKAGVVNRLVAVITSHHYFHVVVQTGGGQTTEVLEGADVFADGGGKVLRLHEPHILAARVSQNVAEGMHAAPPFGGEGNFVGRIIHLRLHSRSRSRIAARAVSALRPEPAQPFAHDGIAAWEPEPAQLLVQPHRREIRIALQQLRDLIRKRVQQARPAHALCSGGARAAILADPPAHAATLLRSIPSRRAMRRCEVPP